MARKVVVIWLSLVMVFGFVIIIDNVTDFIPNVRGTILYVNETGSDGAYMSIQDAINFSSDGDTIFVYQGTYFENIDVTRSISLIGEDVHTTTIEGIGGDDTIEINRNWVNVTGFTITGGGSDFGYACIRVENVHNCSIMGNIADSYNWYGIGIFDSSNNIIMDNIITSKLKFGVDLSQSINNSISNNTMIGSSISIYGEDIIHWNTHVIDTTNTINGKPIYYWKNQNGGEIPSGAGQVILANCSNVTVKNQIINNGSLGISLGFSNYNSISNNTLMNHYCGIFLGFCNKIDIINNTVSSNSAYSILIRFSEGNNITDNYISDTLLGISIERSDFNRIMNNVIHDNDISGVIFYSDNNDFVGNFISRNGNGTYLEDAFNNTVINNTFYANFAWGLNITESSNNTFYHNNFLKNGIQALDYGSGNTWDNGYPSGGNYWDDWTIPDNDRDGFIDNPYIISGGFNQDNYPFSHKWGWDLVAHWPFDEGMGQYANETSGNYNDGILGGTINIEDTDPEWVNGISGSALKFDCVDDYVKVPASDSLNVTGNITIEAWINPFSEGYDYIMYVVAKQDAYEMGLDSNSAKNHIRFELQTSPSSSVYVSSNGEVNLDRWNYIVVTVDSNELKMYINGDLDRVLSGQNVSGVSISNLSIGSASSGSGEFFNGIIDEVYIWNRVLTPTEIQDNYRNGLANSIFMSRGWNLVSIPNIQSDKNLRTVLSSINGSYDSVQYYNISDISDHWKHNQISKPSHLNDLTDIFHTMGFWIHITEPGGVLFKYQDTQPTSNQTIQLHPGWNMVGYPSLTSYNRTDGLNNLTFDDQVDAIWSYNAATQKWEEMGESDYFIIGRGYYIHTKSECEWEVPL